MKYLAVFTFILSLASSVSAQDNQKSAVPAEGKKAEAPQQEKLLCVVTGEEADKDISYEHEGRTYYFCCKGCRKKFEADPAKYIQKANAAEQGSGSEKTVNARCLVSGEELTADAVTLEYEGKLYGFCCAGCRKKFQKNPEKYLLKE